MGNFAETIARIRAEKPEVVAEWEAATIEAEQFATLLAGCMGARSEKDALNVARKLRSEVVRVALRLVRSRAALVVAEQDCKVIVLSEREAVEVLVKGVVLS